MSYHNVVEDEVGDMISDFTYDEFVIDRFYKSMLGDPLNMLLTQMLWSEMTNTIRFPIISEVRRQTREKIIEDEEN